MGKKDATELDVRLLVILAALLFAGGPIWLGLALRPADEEAPGADGPPRPTPNTVTDRIAAPAPPGGSLRISAGPRLRTDEAGARFVQWRTNVPADSFVTWGVSDPVEKVVGKDAALVVDHRVALPANKLVDQYHIQVMSVSEKGQSARARIEPAPAPQPYVTQPIRRE